MAGTILTIRYAGAALLLASAGPVAANVLVVRSSGPSAEQYRPGRSLGLDDPITLRNGDRIVLLSDRGTRMFVGPGTFRPSQPGAARPRLHGIAGVEGRIPLARARVGAVRSGGVDPRRPMPSIWQIDTSGGEGGVICLTSPQGATLWRPDPAPPVRLTIGGPGGESQIEWPAGQSTLAWPRSIPITDGTDYRIATAGARVPLSFRVRLVGAISSDYQAIAGALIANGCQGQLDLLVETLPED